MLSERVARQLADADSLDTKLGVTIAALIALAGAIFVSPLPPVLSGWVSALVVVALIQAIRGFTYDDKFAEGPNSKFYEDRMTMDTLGIKSHSLEVLKAAYKANRDRLDRKGRFLSQVAITVGIVGSLALIGKVLGSP